MIREIVKPQSNRLVIEIPQEYIGQEIEYIVFPLSKNSSFKNKKQKDIRTLRGRLAKYADPKKRELEDKAWELHVKEKFKIDD
jgi:hypothetical protein